MQSSVLKGEIGIARRFLILSKRISMLILSVLNIEKLSTRGLKEPSCDWDEFTCD